MAIMINTDSPPRSAIKTSLAPAAIGPYSQGVLVGSTLYCSGQIAIDPKTGHLIDCGVVGQTERVLENLGAVLSAAGMDYKHVVSCTLYMVDMSDYAQVNEVYARYFSETPPGRAAVAVASLPRGALIEISCVAVR